MNAILNFVTSRPILSLATAAIAGAGIGAFLTRMLSRRTNSAPTISVQIALHRRPAPKRWWSWLKKAALWVANVLAYIAVGAAVKAAYAASEPVVDAVCKMVV